MGIEDLETLGVFSLRCSNRMIQLSELIRVSRQLRFPGEVLELWENIETMKYKERMRISGAERFFIRWKNLD